MKLLSPKVFSHRVDDCMSALSHLGQIKALMSFKTQTCDPVCKLNLFILTNSFHMTNANTGVGTEAFLPHNKAISPILCNSYLARVIIQHNSTFSSNV